MSVTAKEIIRKSKNWVSFNSKFNGLTKKEKGDIFELFVKYFLISHPDYSSILKSVWLFNELTPALKRDYQSHPMITVLILLLKQKMVNTGQYSVNT